MKKCTGNINNLSACIFGQKTEETQQHRQIEIMLRSNLLNKSMCITVTKLQNDIFKVHCF